MKKGRESYNFHATGREDIDIFVESCKIHGELTFGHRYIMLNSRREAVVLKVTNNGDRPIQVGSHYHFIEVNPSLIFDQRKAYGMRLNIPTGTTTRFEPGDAKSVTLVKIGGMQVMESIHAIADSPVTDSNVKTVMESIRARGFGNSKDTSTKLRYQKLFLLVFLYKQ
ncbi:uncharacterized protein LOC111909398 [Lactuca sativa]|uniref:uncharacterized protein LOC111909398 n=1 Tax=Lactuca sativa TaxID=4236 RepID=UPI0022AE9C02|nr:uncharacterized protein LOC111909398 [Lactuca sativa]